MPARTSTFLPGRLGTVMANPQGQHPCRIPRPTPQKQTWSDVNDASQTLARALQTNTTHSEYLRRSASGGSSRRPPTLPKGAIHSQRTAYIAATLMNPRTTRFATHTRSDEDKKSPSKIPAPIQHPISRAHILSPCNHKVQTSTPEPCARNCCLYFPPSPSPLSSTTSTIPAEERPPSPPSTPAKQQPHSAATSLIETQDRAGQKDRQTDRSFICPICLDELLRQDYNAHKKAVVETFAACGNLMGVEIAYADGKREGKERNSAVEERWESGKREGLRIWEEEWREEERRLRAVFDRVGRSCEVVA